jgi:hypothetical protein
MIITDVPGTAGLHLKFSIVCTLAATATTARNREGASSARRSDIKPPVETPVEKRGSGLCRTRK